MLREEESSTLELTFFPTRPFSIDDFPTLGWPVVATNNLSKEQLIRRKSILHIINSSKESINSSKEHLIIIKSSKEQIVNGQKSTHYRMLRVINLKTYRPSQ